MKINGKHWTVACLGFALMAAPAGFAQQQQQSAPNSYQGVSQPPPDDTIVATPDTAPPAEEHATTAKPSPATSMSATTEPATARPYAAGKRSANSGYDNTDFGIVTKPVDPYDEYDAQDTMGAPGSGPVLHTRNTGDYGIVVPPPVPANELPEGTAIRVRMDTALSTTETVSGTRFHGQVIAEVKKDGRVIIPAGSTFRGRVVHVSQGHHFGPAATLRLRPEMVILPDGTAYHLDAQVYNSYAEGTKTGSEGSIVPVSHAVKKAAEYGVGVGTGAMVGAELAGPPGALAGSLAGAGVITTHLLLQSPEAAMVPAGSELDFSLTEPLELTPTRN